MSFGGQYSPLSPVFPSGFRRNPAQEFWSRAYATANLVRDSATPRTIDPVVVVPMSAGFTYMIRGMYFWTAEAGGPSLVWRQNGPAVTLMNIRRGLAVGAQDTTSLTPAYTVRMTNDAGDITSTWNTGGPARALGIIEIAGMYAPSANGNFGIEWTGNSALWAFTRLKGSYLEYRRLA